MSGPFKREIITDFRAQVKLKVKHKEPDADSDSFQSVTCSDVPNSLSLSEVCSISEFVARSYS